MNKGFEIMLPHRAVIALIIGSGVTSIARGMSLAFLAIFLQDSFGYSPGKIGILLGAGALIATIATPILSASSDRLGKINVLISCLIATSLSLTIISFSNHIALFFLAQVIGATAVNLFEVASKAVISDHAKLDDKLRIFSWRYFASNIGWGAGPLIGLAFGAGSSKGFLFSSLAYLLMAFFFWRAFYYLNKSTTKKSPAVAHLPWLEIKSGLNDRRLIFYTIGGACFTAMHGQWSVTLSQYLNLEIEGGLKIFSLLISTNALTVILATHPCRSFIEYFGSRTAMICGTLLFISGCAVFGLVTSAIGLIIGMIIFSLGEVLIIPAEFALVDHIAPTGMKGAYFGVHSLATFGTSIGPVILGMTLGTFGGDAMFFLMAVLSLIAGLAYLMVDLRPFRFS